MLPFFQERFLLGMKNFDDGIRTIQRHNQHVQVAALFHIRNRPDEQNPFSMIFFRNHRQNCRIECRRSVSRTLFFHFCTHFFDECVTFTIFLEKTGFQHTRLKRLEILRVEFHHDLSHIVLRQIVERNFAGFICKLLNRTFIKVESHGTVSQRVRLSVRICIGIRVGFCISLGRCIGGGNHCDRFFRLFDFRLLLHLRNQVARRVKSQTCIFPNLNRNLGETGGVFVTLRNERSRNFKHARRVVAGRDKNNPNDVMRQRNRAQSAEHNFKDCAEYRPFFLLRMRRSTNNLLGC